MVSIDLRSFLKPNLSVSILYPVLVMNSIFSLIYFSEKAAGQSSCLKESQRILESDVKFSFIIRYAL